MWEVLSWGAIGIMNCGDLREGKGWSSGNKVVGGRHYVRHFFF